MTREVLDKIAKYVSLDSPGAKAFLLEGPAGVGKTSITKEYADRIGAKYEFFQAYPGMRFADLTCDYVPDENTRSGIRLAEGVLVRAARKSKISKVVLVLDEYDKTLASADSYLLDFLQNGRVYFADELITANLSNLIVFLTSNGTREFCEPLLRRVIRIKMRFIDPDQMRAILAEKFSQNWIVDALVKVYEKSIALNLRKPATIPELILLGNAILAGLDPHEALLENILKYEEDEAKLDEFANVFSNVDASDNQNPLETGADHIQTLNEHFNHPRFDPINIPEFEDATQHPCFVIFADSAVPSCVTYATSSDLRIVKFNRKLGAIGKVRQLLEFVKFVGLENVAAIALRFKAPVNAEFVSREIRYRGWPPRIRNNETLIVADKIIGNVNSFIRIIANDSETVFEYTFENGNCSGIDGSHERIFGLLCELVDAIGGDIA